MKRLFLVLGMAVVILPWLSGAKAQADAIHWTASGSLLGPNLGNNGVATIFPENGVDAKLSLIPGHATSGTNSGSAVAMEVAVGGANPDRLTAPTFGGPSGNYSLSLALHDDVSGASGSLTFRGNLNGLIEGDNSLSLTNRFFGSTTETLTLGGNLYTVMIGPFVPPDGLPGGGGTIDASIAVKPTTTVNSAPEPSSLVLACLGLPSLGLARRFRRRKDADSDASKA
ncbi:MAG TPA: PEP-CTERM sorting domain-containing protein [Gemmataceae bacterium]